MTELEWWFCVDPSKMLALLKRQQGGRKMRLFAVACCFRIGHLITDLRSQRAVAVAEQYADGMVADEERSEAELAASACYEEQGKGFFKSSIDLGFPRWQGPTLPLPARMAIFSAHSAAN